MHKPMPSTRDNDCDMTMIVLATVSGQSYVYGKARTYRNAADPFPRDVLAIGHNHIE